MCIYVKYLLVQEPKNTETIRKQQTQDKKINLNGQLFSHYEVNIYCSVHWLKKNNSIRVSIGSL